MWAGYPSGVVAVAALARADRGAGGGFDGVGRGERGVVCEQQFGEPLVELEGDVVGEHAEEDVRAHAGLEVVVDRADLDRVLHRSERALGHLQLFVGADRGARAELVGGEGGPDRVEAVERGLLVDLLGLALVDERAVGDRAG